jgi:hypothetical protein
MTGVLVGRSLSESDWQRLFDQRGHPCRCAGNRLCLAHYGMLDPASRTRARRTAGITGFEDRR